MNMVYFLDCEQTKVSYFFISQEKFKFVHFFEKIELVSKKAVFFSRAVFFSYRPRIWVSKYDLNFSREKKNSQNLAFFLFSRVGKKNKISSKRVS